MVEPVNSWRGGCISIRNCRLQQAGLSWCFNGNTDYNCPQNCITEWEWSALVQLSLTDWCTWKTTAWISLISVLDQLAFFMYNQDTPCCPEHTDGFCIVIIHSSSSIFILGNLGFCRRSQEIPFHLASMKEHLHPKKTLSSFPSATFKCPSKGQGLSASETIAAVTNKTPHRHVNASPEMDRSNWTGKLLLPPH